MIATTKKPLAEVLEALAGYRRLGVVGCDGCAKVCATGGTDEVAALAQELQQKGLDVVIQATPERTCNVAKSGPVLEPIKDQIAGVDALLVLGCGGAVQITRYMTEKFGLTKPVKVGLNSVGHMDTVVPGSMAMEECSDCGECILNETGGICPVTRCAKRMLNGPCGGSKETRCEVAEDRPCAWQLIYKRLKGIGQLERLDTIVPPKDWHTAWHAGARRIVREEHRV